MNYKIFTRFLTANVTSEDLMSLRESSSGLFALVDVAVVQRLGRVVCIVLAGFNAQSAVKLELNHATHEIADVKK